MFTSSNQRNVAVILGVCIVAVASLIAYQAGYVDGTKTATDTAVGTTAQNFPPTESRMVLGTVEGVSGQEITLKNAQKVPPPMPGVAIDESARMVVTVTEATIIERNVQKDSATMEEEYTAFQEAMKNQKDVGTVPPPLPPQPFSTEQIAIQDISVGDSLSIFATENIGEGNTLTAERITIVANPPTQAQIPSPGMAIPPTEVAPPPLGAPVLVPPADGVPPEPSQAPEVI